MFRFSSTGYVASFDDRLFPVLVKSSEEVKGPTGMLPVQGGTVLCISDSVRDMRLFGLLSLEVVGDSFSKHIKQFLSCYLHSSSRRLRLLSIP